MWRKNTKVYGEIRNPLCTFVWLVYISGYKLFSLVPLLTFFKSLNGVDKWNNGNLSICPNR